MNRLFLVSAVMMPLAACTSVDDPFLQTGALKADGPALATSVSPDYALAVVPGLEAISVRQTLRENHIEQTILYGNSTSISGENALAVTIGTGGSGFRHAPSQADVAAEMRTALSGVPMRASPVIADNAYGVFGYATGPLGKDGSCVYAWQLARSIAPNGFAGSGYAAQIRLRYCSPSMPQERIALLMQGLRIKPVSSRTFQQLRFAAGTGKVSAVALYQPPPVLERTIEPDVEHVPAVVSVRRTPRESEEKAGEVAIGNAVKVPLPAEPAGLVANGTTPAVDQQQVSAQAVFKPSIVPLPATVAASAQ